MNLSKHFTLEELTRSEYAKLNGIDNTPSELQIENLRQLCLNSLEPLRERVGKPIYVLSAFRCPAVNSGIGGASNSQHLDGKAADIIVNGWTADDLFIEASRHISYDQLIQEFGRWVHVSYSNPLRLMKLWAVKIDGKTKYLREAPSENNSDLT